jgi:hypothetical protein
MVLDDIWNIPILEAIEVTEDELLLLDWIMFSGSQLIPNAPLEDLVTNWSSFRYDVWKGISAFNRRKKVKPVDPTEPIITVEQLEIDEFLVRTLLALVPTTFRWGTGIDCGYELKLKLYRFLANEVENAESESNTESNTENKPPDPTGT